jgi:hypothetical protein
MAARSGSTKRGAVVEDKGGAHWWIGLAKNERSSFEIVDHGRYALVKTKKKKMKERMKTYSQSNHRNIGELSLEDAKILVVRSKVMTPLTTTMCLLQSKSNNKQ